MRSTRLLAVSLVLLIGLAACGSSKSTASGNSPTTTGSTGTSGSSGATTTPKVSGDSSSHFCDEVRKSANAFKPVNPAQLDAAALKTEFENVEPELEQAESAAPSAIKPDFQTFLNAYKPYLDALKAADFDFSKLNVTSLQNLDSTAVKAATTHLEAYFTQVCHVTEATSPTPSVP